MAVRWGKCRNGNRFYFLGFKITVDGDCSHEIKRCLLLGRKAMTNLDNVLKSRDIILLTKVHIVKAMVFPSSHRWMWELDYKEGWAPKNWCFQSMVLEKTLESALDSKEIKPVNPKGNQPWIFIGRTDVEGEPPVLWPLNRKSWLIGKDPDAGKDWGREEKGTTEDEVVGWHHRLNGHEFGWTPGVGSWWWTGRPDVLRFMGSQRVGHYWATELKTEKSLGEVSILGLLLLSRFSRVRPCATP